MAQRLKVGGTITLDGKTKTIAAVSNRNGTRTVSYFKKGKSGATSSTSR